MHSMHIKLRLSDLLNIVTVLEQLFDAVKSHTELTKKFNGRWTWELSGDVDVNFAEIKFSDGYTLTDIPLV